MKRDREEPYASERRVAPRLEDSVSHIDEITPPLAGVAASVAGPIPIQRFYPDLHKLVYPNASLIFIPSDIDVTTLTQLFKDFTRKRRNPISFNAYAKLCRTLRMSDEAFVTSAKAIGIGVGQSDNHLKTEYRMSRGEDPRFRAVVKSPQWFHAWRMRANAVTAQDDEMSPMTINEQVYLTGEERDELNSTGALFFGHMNEFWTLIKYDEFRNRHPEPDARFKRHADKRIMEAMAVTDAEYDEKTWPELDYMYDRLAGKIWGACLAFDLPGAWQHIVRTMGSRYTLGDGDYNFALCNAKSRHSALTFLSMITHPRQYGGMSNGILSRPALAANDFFDSLLTAPSFSFDDINRHLFDLSNRIGVLTAFTKNKETDERALHRIVSRIWKNERWDSLPLLVFLLHHSLTARLFTATLTSGSTSPTRRENAMKFAREYWLIPSTVDIGDTDALTTEVKMWGPETIRSVWFNSHVLVGQRSGRRLTKPTLGGGEEHWHRVFTDPIETIDTFALATLFLTKGKELIARLLRYENDLISFTELLLRNGRIDTLQLLYLALPAVKLIALSSTFYHNLFVVFDHMPQEYAWQTQILVRFFRGNPYTIVYTAKMLVARNFEFYKLTAAVGDFLEMNYLQASRDPHRRGGRIPIDHDIPTAAVFQDDITSSIPSPESDASGTVVDSDLDDSEGEESFGDEGSSSSNPDGFDEEEEEEEEGEEESHNYDDEVEDKSNYDDEEEYGEGEVGESDDDDDNGEDSYDSDSMSLDSVVIMYNPPDDEEDHDSNIGFVPGN